MLRTVSLLIYPSSLFQASAILELHIIDHFCLTTMAISKPTFVFAPGAWHSSECFYLVVERLRARCYATESVSYPSYGAEPPNKTLADGVAALRAPLERLTNKENEIVLVAHSYGGIVAANATEGLGQKSRAEIGNKGGVIMFVYLAAFVVPKGKSMTDMFGG